MDEQKPARKITPYTKRWEKMADEMARSYVRIVPCKECGHPRHDGYICQNCGKE